MSLPRSLSRRYGDVLDAAPAAAASVSSALVSAVPSAGLDAWALLRALALLVLGDDTAPPTFLAACPGIAAAVAAAVPRVRATLEAFERRLAAARAAAADPDASADDVRAAAAAAASALLGHRALVARAAAPAACLARCGLARWRGFTEATGPLRRCLAALDSAVGEVALPMVAPSADLVASAFRSADLSRAVPALEPDDAVAVAAASLRATLRESAAAGSAPGGFAAALAAFRSAASARCPDLPSPLPRADDPVSARAAAVAEAAAAAEAEAGAGGAAPGSAGVAVPGVGASLRHAVPLAGRVATPEGRFVSAGGSVSLDVGGAFDGVVVSFDSTGACRGSASLGPAAALAGAGSPAGSPLALLARAVAAAGGPLAVALASPHPSRAGGALAASGFAWQGPGLGGRAVRLSPWAGGRGAGPAGAWLTGSSEASGAASLLLPGPQPPGGPSYTRSAIASLVGAPPSDDLGDSAPADGRAAPASASAPAPGSAAPLRPARLALLADELAVRVAAAAAAVGAKPWEVAAALGSASCWQSDVDRCCVPLPGHGVWVRVRGPCGGEARAARAALASSRDSYTALGRRAWGRAVAAGTADATAAGPAPIGAEEADGWAVSPQDARRGAGWWAAGVVVGYTSSGAVLQLLARAAAPSADEAYGVVVVRPWADVAPRDGRPMLPPPEGRSALAAPLVVGAATSAQAGAELYRRSTSSVERASSAGAVPLTAPTRSGLASAGAEPPAVALGARVLVLDVDAAVPLPGAPPRGPVRTALSGTVVRYSLDPPGAPPGAPPRCRATVRLDVGGGLATVPAARLRSLRPLLAGAPPPALAARGRVVVTTLASARRRDARLTLLPDGREPVEQIAAAAFGQSWSWAATDEGIATVEPDETAMPDGAERAAEARDHAAAADGRVAAPGPGGGDVVVEGPVTGHDVAAPRWLLARTVGGRALVGRAEAVTGPAALCSVPLAALPALRMERALEAGSAPRGLLMPRWVRGAARGSAAAVTVAALRALQASVTPSSRLALGDLRAAPAMTSSDRGATAAVVALCPREAGPAPPAGGPGSPSPAVSRPGDEAVLAAAAASGLERSWAVDVGGGAAVSLGGSAAWTLEAWCRPDAHAVSLLAGAEGRAAAAEGGAKPESEPAAEASSGAGAGEAVVAGAGAAEAAARAALLAAVSSPEGSLPCDGAWAERVLVSKGCLGGGGEAQFGVDGRGRLFVRRWQPVTLAAGPYRASFLRMGSSADTGSADTGSADDAEPLRAGLDRSCLGGGDPGAARVAVLGEDVSVVVRVAGGFVRRAGDAVALLPVGAPSAGASSVPAASVARCGGVARFRASGAASRPGVYEARYLRGGDCLARSAPLLLLLPPDVPMSDAELALRLAYGGEDAEVSDFGGGGAAASLASLAAARPSERQLEEIERIEASDPAALALLVERTVAAMRREAPASLGRAQTRLLGLAARGRLPAWGPEEARSAAALPEGRWSHVAATYDGMALRLWQGGRLVAATTDARGSRPAAPSEPACPVRIGAVAATPTWARRCALAARSAGRAWAVARLAALDAGSAGSAGPRSSAALRELVRSRVAGGTGGSAPRGDASSLLVCGWSGRIAEARVWAAALPGPTLRGMRGLAARGGEPALLGAWSLQSREPVARARGPLGLHGVPAPFLSGVVVAEGRDEAAAALASAATDAPVWSSTDAVPGVGSLGDGRFGGDGADPPPPRSLGGAHTLLAAPAPGSAGSAGSAGVPFPASGWLGSNSASASAVPSGPAAGLAAPTSAEAGLLCTGSAASWSASVLRLWTDVDAAAAAASLLPPNASPGETLPLWCGFAWAGRPVDGSSGLWCGAAATLCPGTHVTLVWTAAVSDAETDPPAAAAGCLPAPAPTRDALTLGLCPDAASDLAVVGSGEAGPGADVVPSKRWCRAALPAGGAAAAEAEAQACLGLVVPPSVAGGGGAGGDAAVSRRRLARTRALAARPPAAAADLAPLPTSGTARPAELRPRTVAVVVARLCLDRPLYEVRAYARGPRGEASLLAEARVQGGESLAIAATAAEGRLRVTIDGSAGSTGVESSVLDVGLDLGEVLGSGPGSAEGPRCVGGGAPGVWSGIAGGPDIVGASRTGVALRPWGSPGRRETAARTERRGMAGLAEEAEDADEAEEEAGAGEAAAGAEAAGAPGADAAAAEPRVVLTPPSGPGTKWTVAFPAELGVPERQASTGGAARRFAAKLAPGVMVVEAAPSAAASGPAPAAPPAAPAAMSDAARLAGSANALLSSLDRASAAAEATEADPRAAPVRGAVVLRRWETGGFTPAGARCRAAEEAAGAGAGSSARVTAAADEAASLAAPSLAGVAAVALELTSAALPSAFFRDWAAQRARLRALLAGGMSGAEGLLAGVGLLVRLAEPSGGFAASRAGTVRETVSRLLSRSSGAVAEARAAADAATERWRAAEARTDGPGRAAAEAAAAAAVGALICWGLEQCSAASLAAWALLTLFGEALPASSLFAGYRSAWRDGAVSRLRNAAGHAMESLRYRASAAVAAAAGCGGEVADACLMAAATAEAEARTRREEGATRRRRRPTTTRRPEGRSAASRPRSWRGPAVSRPRGVPGRPSRGPASAPALWRPCRPASPCA